MANRTAHAAAGATDAALRKVLVGLLGPYLVWVTFATALNLAVWRFNPSAAQG
jgi:tryptophan-rich sensory protein